MEFERTKQMPMCVKLKVRQLDVATNKKPIADIIQNKKYDHFLILSMNICDL